MPTLEQIQQQASKLDGVSKFFARKELKELPKILHENEVLANMAQGTYENSNGLLVATNRRLVFIDKGIFKLKVEDFPFDKISSVQFNLGILHGSITVFCSGNKAAIKNIYPKQKARELGDYIRERISGKVEEIKSQAPVLSVAEQLKELAVLKEQGILTEEEFNSQKQKILA